MLLLVATALAETLTLERAVAAAEDHVVQLKMASEQTRQAELRVGQSAAMLTPKVVAQGNYTINDQEVALDFSAMIPEDFASLFPDMEPTVVQQKSYADASLSVIQPLFNPAAFPTMVAARSAAEAARQDEAQARRSIRGATAQIYYGLLVAQESVKILEESVKTAEAQLKLARTQVEVGLAPPLAALQAEVGLAQAQRQLSQARQQAVQVEELFRTFTGLEGDFELAMPEVPALEFSTVEEALELARNQRADLMAAQARARAAQAAYRADTLMWLPTVDVRGTAYYTQNTGFIDDNTRWMVVGTASWTLWDGGYRMQNNRVNASVARTAVLAETYAWEQAELEVREAWEARSAALVTLQAVQREQALAEEAWRLTEVAAQAGSASWLELEQARTNRDLARLQALSYQAQADLASIQLATAVGSY